MTEAEIKILLGKNVKYLRNKRQLSQMQLAEQADVTFNFINDIENGKKWVSPTTLSKLSAVLHIPLYQFFVDIQPTMQDSGAPHELLAAFSTDVLNQINAVMQSTLERYNGTVGA